MKGRDQFTEAEAPDALVEAAIAALKGRVHSLAEAKARLPAAAGLYAIYGGADAWAELALGDRPDDRPLYVGKAERSLLSRDLNTHFGDGRTGSSTVRRSIAALLREALGLRGIPRNPAKPERPANFGLSPEHNAALTRWMKQRLSLAIWCKPGECEDLLAVEVAVLKRIEPPLNLKDVATSWSAQVRVARRVMADDAWAWARERGIAK